ncbi:MAG: polysaccharide deacetylase family protein [Solirubrobacteraceae bacterium]|nr:polysaccharide deacetylase family protein [Solirubrobacteraceae bacterium]
MSPFDPDDRSAVIAARREASRAALARTHRRRRAVALAALGAVLVVLIGVVQVLAGGDPELGPQLSLHHQIPAASFVVSPTFGDPEATAVEETRKRMPVVAVAGRRKREIALTFDDGPGPYTPAVAKALDKARAPATFFQVGQPTQVFRPAERSLVENPQFVLADHTEGHLNLSEQSRAKQISEIDDAASMLTKSGAPAPQLFRPPYGAFNRTTLDLLGRRHMLMVLWTIDSQDYERPGVDAIVRRVVDDAHPGAIVLMHDAGGDRTQTIAAIPKIVKALRAKHYTLVTVPRLLLDNPPPVKQPAIPVGAG